MKVAVTGATGFIGRHVMLQLERLGLEPTVVARPGTPIPPNVHRTAFVECDIQRPPENIFERMGRPQLLIHLAWDGLPNYKSLHHFEDELPAQYRFLKSLIVSGLESCLITGTCLEYGMQSGKLSEDASAVPTTSYGFAKDCLRRQLEWLRATSPFQLTWTRLFYTYGDGQAATSLYSLLKAAAERGDQTFDMSDGKQLRDYLPVEEVAKSIVELALRGRDLGIVNVCSGRAVSVREMVEEWMMKNGWSFQLNLGRLSYPDYEPEKFWGARDKLDSVIRASDD